MKIINITAMWLFLFMFLLPTMTMADSAYSTEEKKERVILKSELEELRVLLDKIDAQIIMAKKIVAPIYNPSAKIQEITSDLSEYHPYIKEMIILIDKDIKEMEKGQVISASISEEYYENIMTFRLANHELNKLLYVLIKKLKKDFPEL